VQKRVFDLWHLFRGGACSRAQLDDGIAPLLLHLLEDLQGACVVGIARPSASARVCWGFIREGVEPTNNHLERAQPRAVLWRRRSFGCQSAAGCRSVERILTVAQTQRLHHGRACSSSMRQSRLQVYELHRH
jgi:hypothetical protein